MLLGHYSYITGLTIIETSILIRPWSSIWLAKNLWTTWWATIWNCRITVRVTCTTALLCTQTCIAPTLKGCSCNFNILSISIFSLWFEILWNDYVAVEWYVFLFQMYTLCNRTLGWRCCLIWSIDWDIDTNCIQKSLLYIRVRSNSIDSCRNQPCQRIFIRLVIIVITCLVESS